MTPDALLDAVRRRLRVQRSVRALLRSAWIPVVLVALALLALRFAGPPSLRAVVLVAAAVSIVGLAAWAFTRPVTAADAAAVADRSLQTQDAFAAYLDFGSEVGGDGSASGGGLHTRIAARASGIASAAEPAAAAPWHAPSAPGVALLAVGLVAVLGLLLAGDPGAAERERAVAAEAARDAAADTVEQAAEELAEQQGSAADAEALAALADQMRGMSPDDAMSALAAEEARLNRAAGPDLNSAIAAASGLNRSVQAEPLPGSDGGDAAEQLAEGLAGMSPAERAELAERLADLAATQAAGAPEVADALRSAAAAVAAGDPSAAEQLAAAGAAQAGAEAAVAERAAAAGAASTLGAARQRMDAANGAAGAAGQHAAGAGESAGKGTGDGKGAGEGTGEGSGQGGGSGKGAGAGASGQIAGGDRTGSGSGSGGAGSVGGGATPSGPDAGTAGEAGRQGATVHVPAGQVAPGGPMAGTGGGLESRVGTGDTTTGIGSARLPLSEAIARYRDAATAAANQPGVPNAQRDLINDYFRRLSSEEP